MPARSVAPTAQKDASLLQATMPPPPFNALSANASDPNLSSYQKALSVISAANGPCPKATRTAVLSAFTRGYEAQADVHDRITLALGNYNTYASNEGADAPTVLTSLKSAGVVAMKYAGERRGDPVAPKVGALGENEARSIEAIRNAQDALPTHVDPATILASEEGQAFVAALAGYAPGQQYGTELREMQAALDAAAEAQPEAAEEHTASIDEAA